MIQWVRLCIKYQHICEDFEEGTLCAYRAYAQTSAFYHARSVPGCSIFTKQNNTHTHTQRDITHHIFSSCNERVPSLGFLEQLLGTAQPSCQGVHSHGPHGQEWTLVFWSWNFQGPRHQISEDWQRHIWWHHNHHYQTNWIYTFQLSLHT